jgi:hypothetical protein
MAVSCQIECSPGVCLEEKLKSVKNFIEDRYCPNRVPNRAPSMNESRVLPLR